MMLCVVAVNTISDVYSVLNIVDTPLHDSYHTLYSPLETTKLDKLNKYTHQKYFFLIFSQSYKYSTVKKDMIVADGNTISDGIYMHVDRYIVFEIDFQTLQQPPLQQQYSVFPDCPDILLTSLLMVLMQF